MIKTRSFFSVFFGVIFLSGLYGSAVFAQTNPIILGDASRTSTSSVVYSEQELSSLLKPSIVRIVQHIQGTATIPSFIIDKTGLITLDKNKKTATVPIDNINILGSGFFVSDDGYILTNAHFVSETSSKLMVVSSFVKTSLEAGIVDQKTGKVKYRTPEEVDTVMREMFTDQTVDFILKNTTFTIKREIVVIDPKNNQPVLKDTVFNLFKVGASAAVVYVNDNFYTQGDDIALLKISGNGFPSVDFSSKEMLAVSDTVFVFKLPIFGLAKSIDELSIGGVSVAEIASAIIVKSETAASSTSQVYKTDLLGGDDSSGGMAFDNAGTVVGLIAYDGKKYILDKDTQYQTIIPVNVLRDILKKNSIAEKESVFGSRARSGFIAAEKLLCENAAKHFSIATSLGSSFVPANYFDPYVTRCEDASKTASVASQKKWVGAFSFFLPIKEKVIELWNIRWVSITLLIFLTIVLLVLLISIIRELFRKKTTGERLDGIGSERSEEVSQARRTTLSEKIPLEEDEKVLPGRIDYPSKNMVTIPKKQEPILKNTSSTFISNEKKDKGFETFKTSIAGFPARSDVAQSLEVSTELEGIPAGDKEMLVSLWPTKYGDKGAVDPVAKTSPFGGTAKIDPIKNEVVKEPQTVVEKIKPENTNQTTAVEIPIDYTPIVDYVKQTRELGFSDDLIKKELLKAGWKEDVVAIVFTRMK